MNIKGSLSQLIAYPQRLSQSYLPKSLSKAEWHGYSVVYYTVGTGATVLLAYLIFLVGKLAHCILYPSLAASRTTEVRGVEGSIPKLKVEQEDSPLAQQKKELPQHLYDVLGSDTSDYLDPLLSITTLERLKAIGLFDREDAVKGSAFFNEWKKIAEFDTRDTLQIPLKDFIQGLKKQITDTTAFDVGEKEKSLKACKEEDDYKRFITSLEEIHQNLLSEIQEEQVEVFSELLNVLSKVSCLRFSEERSRDAYYECLGLADPQDFSDDLGCNVAKHARYGIVAIEDIEALGLLDIERDLIELQGLCILIQFSLNRELKEAVTMPEFNSRFTELYKKMNNFLESDIGAKLENFDFGGKIQEIPDSINSETCTFLQGELGRLILKDRERQKVLLRAYLLQTYHNKAWEKIRQSLGKEATVSSLAKDYKLGPDTLFSIGVDVDKILSSGASKT